MPARKWDLPHGVKTLIVNGYEMAYRECGQGVPLVLIHGSLNDYRVWEFQMEAFGSGYRTIALSLRHFYPEPWRGEGDDFTLRQHSEDVAAFIRALDAGPVHLLAHSRGGNVALMVASGHPSILRSLILSDPAPFDTMLPNTTDALAAARKRKDFVIASLQHIEQGDVDNGLEVFTDSVSVPGTWKHLQESAKQVRRENAWSLKSLLDDMQTPFDRSDAEKIGVPVLLLTAEKSPGLYGMMHDALKPCLRNWQQETIADASHGMQKDNPHMFNNAVLNFLSKQMEV